MTRSTPASIARGPSRGSASRPGADEAHYLRVSRASVLCFGALLAAIAYAFSHFQGILWLAFKIGGVTYGSLLGVFLLGLTTRRRANAGNVGAMGTSAPAMLALLVLAERGTIALGWSWLIVLGTGLTFAIGWVWGGQAEEAT